MRIVTQISPGCPSSPDLSPEWCDGKAIHQYSINVMSMVMHRIQVGRRNIPLKDRKGSPLRYSSKLGALVWNILKTCTILLPTTTNMKKKIKLLLMGGSSTCSPALPIGTCPRLLIFLSNLLLRLRRLRGAGCVCGVGVLGTGRGDG